MDTPTSVSASCSIAERPARIVYDRPPSKHPPARRMPPARTPPASTSVPEPPRALTSPAALQVFLKLIGTWKLSPARGWRTPTGVGWQAGSLTSDQIAQVEHLVAIDAGLRAIRMSPGEWMVTTNPAPVLSRSAPVDYLTQVGTRSYKASTQQVDRWVEM